MLQLLKLFIVGLAVTVQESSGLVTSPFPAASPIHYENKSTSATNSPPEADGHVESHAPVALPAIHPSGMHAPVPKVVEGLEPSASPGSLNLNPPFSVSPLQPRFPNPPASPVSPIILPPFVTSRPQPRFPNPPASPISPFIPSPFEASPPQPRFPSPPASPISPIISPPFEASPPQTSFSEPTVSPSSPTLSPLPKASPPPPSFLQPPVLPSSPTLSPPSKASPPLPTSIEPPASPRSPTLSSPLIASPPLPTFHEPPASPRPPTLPPLSKASPPQPTFLEPPASPSYPTLSPPFIASPPHPIFLEPPASPSSPALSPPFKAYPPHPLFRGHVPSEKIPPPEKQPHKRSPVSLPVASAPTGTPSKASPKHSPAIRPSTNGSLPPIAHRSNAPNKKTPNPESISPVSVASPPPNLGKNQPVEDPLAPNISPSILPARQRVSRHKLPAPSSAPPLNPPSNLDWGRDKIPVIAPPSPMQKLLPPAVHSPAQAEAPSANEKGKHMHHVPPPSMVSANSSSGKRYHTPAPVPSPSSHKDHHPRNQVSSPAPTFDLGSPSTWEPQAVPPSLIPTSRRTFSPPPLKPVSPKMPILPHFHALPPPPPNEDCLSTVCSEPYTNTAPESPCGCVLPMQVGLQLSVALYTFFPLVSELAAEIAAGLLMKQSQVRIMGANAATQQPEKTVVLIDLVPPWGKFDHTTAFLTSERFWHKKVMIQASYFGNYDILYVTYPGLPPSPPLPPSTITIIDGGPYSGSNSNAGAIKPLGVDVPKRRHKDAFNGGVIAIITLSAFVAVILCFAAAWVFLFKGKHHVDQQPASMPKGSIPSLTKPSGNGGSLVGSGPSSTSPSFGSSIAAYKGTTRTFTMNDIERATDNFNDSRVLGEGGFGRVYSGVLDDGINVAVKVLKRNDQQGGREFLAEVEMLSRLHHRNLVKLIGICTEDRIRCLVYELIPNGSVESYLHGVEKETAPLDWSTRMKIALGSARGLAYLHEDSSPRVIHRDFKSGNILLEHDFTPKVSDFGLARTAMDEENTHISTRVMGTFGYVAPEYAMTGHLLVKSDVYSYGVVLLELFTGRKPVDMSQPPGQENLVAWARPLLTSKEGLEMIVDPYLTSDVPLESIAKVAAIASMCVQPDVSNRPFMGEVVQALKLVCNECDEANETVAQSCSMDDISMDLETGVSYASSHAPDHLGRQYSIGNFPSTHDVEEGGYSASELFSSSARLPRPSSPSYTRLSASGSLRTGRNRQFWRILKRFSGGSVSEHGMMFRL